MGLARCFVIVAGLLSALLVWSPGREDAAQPKPAWVSKPAGEMRCALYVTLAPQWFDPAEVQGQITRARAVRAHLRVRLAEAGSDRESKRRR
jgi:hypothetical protein